MDLSQRQGNTGNDLMGMAWDEMALVPVVTPSVVFTALEVYNNAGRCGSVEIELYTGISELSFSTVLYFHYIPFSTEYPCHR